MTREQFINNVEKSQRPFRKFLTALCCGDTMLADDIAQESFMKAYLRIDSLSDTEKFKQWLYRIGYNTFLNQKRTQRAEASLEEMEKSVACDTSDSSFRYEELYQALDKIGERERYAILLYYMEGYSVNEISETVGTTPGAVKQQLSRGRMRLRHLIDSKD